MLKTILASLGIFAITMLLSTKLFHSAPPDERPLNYSLFKPEIVNALDMGYPYLWGQLLWIETVAYFGEHLDNSDFPYLASRLRLIVSLNPKAEHVYYMAASVLPWNTGNTVLSRPLLETAMKSMPNDWRWPYYAGFNAYWFDHNPKSAADYLVKAATLPGVHPIVSRLAVRMQSESGSFDVALTFLDNQIKETTDHNIRAQLQAQKTAILTEQILQDIEAHLKHLPKKDWNMDSIKGIAYHIPKVLPDGGHVMFTDSGVLISSKITKRFKVFVPPKRVSSLRKEIQ